MAAATRPTDPMRPAEDYEPGPVQIILNGCPVTPAGVGPADQAVYRIRSAEDTAFILAADDDGGVTQNVEYSWGLLAAAGVPGIPASFAQVHEMFQFSWAQGDHPLDDPRTGTVLPGQHQAMLALFADRLTKPAVDAETTAITAIADELLDELLPPAGGTFDAAAYTRHLAFRAAAHLAGIPLDGDVETVMLAMFDRFSRRDTVAVIPAADPAEQAFLETLLAGRAPGLLADTAAARDKGQITSPEAYGMIRGWLHAGTDTTGGTTATLLAFLGTGEGREWQDRARAVTGRDQAKLLTGYLQESARLWPTFPEMFFTTYQPVTLPSGVTIPANRTVLIVLPAVSRDPARAGDSPRVFRPGRRASYAWAAGKHSCTGKYLALVTGTIGVSAVLDHTATLTLPADGWLSQPGLVTTIDRCTLTCTPAGLLRDIMER